MKHKNSGFSIVELLTVVVIISILVGLLLPGISMVRNLAKTTQQKAQFTALELGIEAFKNDNGQYPESERTNSNGIYLGAQKLAEAMVGRDMLGFHPDSDWGGNYNTCYPGINGTFNPEQGNSDWDNLQKRKDLYLDSTKDVYNLGGTKSGDYTKGGLYYGLSYLDEDSLVICDAFNRNKVLVGSDEPKATKVGSPILYFRANTLKLQNDSGDNPSDRTYNIHDNYLLIKSISEFLRDEKELYENEDIQETFYNVSDTYDNFYEFIRDEKIDEPDRWPVNSKTYLLISAGRDGLYGTQDDICNFDK